MHPSDLIIVFPPAGVKETTFQSGIFVLDTQTVYGVIHPHPRPYSPVYTLIEQHLTEAQIVGYCGDKTISAPKYVVHVASCRLGLGDYYTITLQSPYNTTDFIDSLAVLGYSVTATSLV